MNVRYVIKSAVRAILHCVPKNKNKIMFESDPDFSDNSRAFFDYLIKNKLNDTLTIIWCVRNPEKFHDLNIKNVKFTSFRNRKYYLSYLWNVATAKTVLYTHATPPLINVQKQTVICLWHGTPLKKIAMTNDNKTTFSFILSASDFCSKSLTDCCKIPNEKIKIFGYPRNDLLFADVDALKQLGINKINYDRIILWMPTFRQSEQINIKDCEKTPSGLPLIETSELLLSLNKKLLAFNQFMIIKLHPLQDMTDIEFSDFTNIKMLTNAQLDENKVQLYHLVSDCDVLLTDYSSIYFDFLLLNRPIGFIVDDIGEYQKNRGFVTDNPYELMPGMKINTPEELFEFLQNVKDNIDDFSDSRAKVNSLVNQYTDQNSSKRLLDFLHIN